MSAAVDSSDDVFCRICRAPAEEHRPLFYPCKCSGSIKFVHEDCLAEWLRHSGLVECEVCKHKFSFTYLYNDGAPRVLPFYELVCGAALKVGKIACLSFKVAVCVLAWLVALPLLTLAIWRATITEQPHRWHHIFLQRLSQPTYLITDMMQGLVVAGITLGLELSIVFSASSFSASVTQFVDSVARSLRLRSRPFVAAAHDGVNAAPLPIDWSDTEHTSDEQTADSSSSTAESSSDAGSPVAAEAAVQRNVEDVLARFEQQLEQDLPLRIDGENEEETFGSVIGYEGSTWNLCRALVLVVFHQFVYFLALQWFVYVPIILGFLLFPTLKSIPRGSMLAPHALIDMVLAVTTRPFAAQNATALLPASDAVVAADQSSPPAAMDKLVDDMVFFLGQSPSHQEHKNIVEFLTAVHAVAEDLQSNLAVPSWSRTIAWMNGFGMLETLCLAAGWAWLSWLVMGQCRRLGFSVSIVHAAVGIAREVAGATARHLKQVLLAMKVAVVVTLELVVLPGVIGHFAVWCAQPVLGGSLALPIAPVALFTVVLRWLIGATFVLGIAAIAHICKELLRPEIVRMLWSNDSHDDVNDLLRDIRSESIHRIAYRLCVAMAMYLGVIVVCVCLPCRLARWLLPHGFPFRIRLTDPFTEVPFDLLLFHVLVPAALEYLQARHAVRVCLKHWLKWVEKLLQLDVLHRSSRAVSDRGERTWLCTSRSTEGRLLLAQAAAVIPFAAWRSAAERLQSDSGLLTGVIFSVSSDGSVSVLLLVPVDLEQDRTASALMHYLLTYGGSKSAALPAGDEQKQDLATQTAVAPPATSATTLPAGQQAQAVDAAQLDDVLLGAAVPRSEAACTAPASTAPPSGRQQTSSGRQTSNNMQASSSSVPHAAVDGEVPSVPSTACAATSRQHIPHQTLDTGNVHDDPDEERAGVAAASFASELAQHDDRAADTSASADAEQPASTSTGMPSVALFELYGWHRPDSPGASGNRPLVVLTQDSRMGRCSSSATAASRRHAARRAADAATTQSATEHGNTQHWANTTAQQASTSSGPHGSAAGVEGGYGGGDTRRVLVWLLSRSQIEGRTSDAQLRQLAERRKLSPRKLSMLVALVFCAVVGFNTFLLTVPLMVGRVVLRATNLPFRNDIYCLLVGLQLVFGAAVAAVKATPIVRHADVRSVCRQCCALAFRGLQVFVLAVLWLGLVPVLLGLLIDLTLLPVHVGRGVTPLFVPYQSWMLGILGLKMWHRLVMVLPEATPAGQQSWRARLEAFERRGVRGLQFRWTLQCIVVPMLDTLATYLAVPYVVAWGVLPLCRAPTPVIEFARLYAFLMTAAARPAWIGLMRLKQYAVIWHNRIRDERYLLKKQLNNFQNHKAADGQSSAQRGASAAAAGGQHDAVVGSSVPED